MKKNLIILLLGFPFCCAAQQPDLIKGPALGIHFLYQDIPRAYRIKDMDAGFALSFIKGLSPHLDFSTSLAAAFPAKGRLAEGNNRLLISWDGMLHGKMFTDNRTVSPYLALGVAGAKYAGNYAALLPAGLGIQVNIKNDAFILLNTQYRAVVAGRMESYFFHSIGIAGNIGKKRTIRKIPPPPLPIMSSVADQDDDGVPDSEDACPAIAGLRRYKGCPDRDNDGIPDNEDKCPDVPGVARFSGCPVPDQDGDGINDEEDKCPDVPGVARYLGCPVPDTDKDSLNDEEDQCPLVAGPVSNRGCPVVAAHIQQQADEAARHILFETGSARLLAASDKPLAIIADLLKADGAINAVIKGHTDNTGTAAANQLLSLQRAEAVKTWLMTKGIASSRLTIQAFGATQPIDTNATPKGRARNRRVEVKLKM